VLVVVTTPATPRPSIRSAVRWLVAVALCTVSFSNQARADDVITLEEVAAFARVTLAREAGISVAVQPQDAKDASEFLRKVQDKILRPCFLNILDVCQNTASGLVAQLKAFGMAPQRWAVSIRNNMYLYLMAPSLRLALVIVRAPGGCAAWQARAKSAGTSLVELQADAEAEVGTRTNLPEFRELRELEPFRMCGAAD
jgi:hypothetical protein